MKRRATIVIILIFIGLLFLVLGFPLLRFVKEKAADIGSEVVLDVENETEGGREVRLDLTVEDICTNPVTGEIELECQSPGGCQVTCQTRGCEYFGLEYKRSEFMSNRCYCICLEENKIVKALQQS